MSTEEEKERLEVDERVGGDGGGAGTDGGGVPTRFDQTTKLKKIPFSRVDERFMNRFQFLSQFFFF